MIAIDLFCGAGGLSLGMESIGVEVIIANEIEKDFATTYKINHPHTLMFNQDVHEINFQDEVAKLNKTNMVDLVCGGPPCQGFSTVGKKNYQDKRNSLFWEFLRVVSEVNPKYVLFENVAGFKNMYSGQAYLTLKDELEKLGYAVKSSILDAADYGLPQKRLRTIVAAWKDKNKEFYFPEPTHVNKKDLISSNKYLSLIDAISDLPALESGQEKNTYLSEPKNDYQKLLRGNEKALTEHNASNYGIKMQEILRLVPVGGCVNDLPLELRPKSYFANTYARLLPNQPSPTITRNFGTPSSSRCIHPHQNRALSTREGARLQGFPDYYKFYGAKGSKNLQIGNAVPPILGKVIAESFLKLK